MLLGKSSSIQIINMIKFTNRLMVTLGFEEHRLAFWDSLTEINRNYMLQVQTLINQKKIEVIFKN